MKIEKEKIHRNDNAIWDIISTHCPFILFKPKPDITLSVKGKFSVLRKLSYLCLNILEDGFIEKIEAV